LSLYNKNLFYWPLQVGDHVAFVRHPFFEYKAEFIFKVTAANPNKTYNIICVKSNFINVIDIGTVYINQPLDSFRKVKFTTITEDFDYNYRI
jgi:hypothetical protein